MVEQLEVEEDLLQALTAQDSTRTQVMSLIVAEEVSVVLQVAATTSSSPVVLVVLLPDRTELPCP